MFVLERLVPSIFYLVSLSIYIATCSVEVTIIIIIIF